MEPLYLTGKKKCIFSFWGMKSFHSNLIARCIVTEEAAQREEIKCYMGCEPGVNPQLQKGTGKPIIASSSVKALSSLSQSRSSTFPPAHQAMVVRAPVQPQLKQEVQKWRDRSDVGVVLPP